MELEELKVLEEKVVGLLERYRAACAERDRYRTALEASERRLAELEREAESHRAERERLRERVARLLERLDGLEAA